MTENNYIETIKTLNKSHPKNLSLKYFLEVLPWYATLDDELKQRVQKIIKSGVECPDSSVGAYINQESDLTEIAPLLDKIIADYHNLADLDSFKHITSWDGIESLPSLPVEVSTRSRVARNVVGLPLPSSMSKDQRVEFEQKVQKITKDAGLEGNWYSLTPNSAYEIDDEKYNELVEAHLFYKDMSSDPYLKAAGISEDWPYGRAAFVLQKDGMNLGIWVGEEDHLRIWTFGVTSDLAKVLGTLKSWLDVFENAGLKFMRDDKYGYVTTCPTNLGTGNRTSVHLKLPNLTNGGTEIPAELKTKGKEFGLSVRGKGGEHTPPGSDGTVDISISKRMGITEFEIAKNLVEGVNKLVALETA